MDKDKYPFAVRLLGFEPAEHAQIAAMLDLAPAHGPGYVPLHEDSLQEPDLFVANGSRIEALAALAACNPDPMRPALAIGAALPELCAACVERPLDMRVLLAELARLVDLRAEAIARRSARGLPTVPERRRRQRPDLDLSDPSRYLAQRKEPPDGAVLIVDKGASLRDHVSRLLGGRKRAVEWTDCAAAALRLCDETPVAVVLVNTATPNIDPYGLCASIKALPNAQRTAVVFLVGGTFGYDTVRARSVGVRGLLDKPVADRHLAGALKKLLSLPT